MAAHPAEVLEQPTTVIETRTLPQGLTSLFLAFDSGKTIEENYERMTSRLERRGQR